MLNYVLAVASGLLLVLSAPRFDLVWLAPVALTPLLIAAAREPRLLRRILLGEICGIVYWFGICYWIQFVLAVHGGLGQALGWAVFLLFCFTKALHMAAFTLLAALAIRVWWAAIAVPALWVGIEVTHGPLGFAWFTLGNAGTEMGIPMRLAPLTGVYGLSFVFAMMGTGLALAALRWPRWQLAPLVLLPLVITLPALPEAKRGAETAVLVQPNVSEDEQWTPQSLGHLQDRLGFLSMRTALTGGDRRPSLIAWPEVPAPLYFDNDPRFREFAINLARTSQAYLLLGVVGHTPDGRPLNSAQLISPAGDPISRYDKMKLVPFGEFVPWPFGFANKISTEIGDFRAGSTAVVSPVGQHRIGTFICYESAFPNLVRRFANSGAELLFNISNDGWFGRSAARDQHLKIVRMRAAENRRWILRSTNNGITATIDDAGRLRGTVPQYVEAASRTGFSYVQQRTLYTRWGDWFPVLCLVVAAAAVWRGAKEV